MCNSRKKSNRKFEVRLIVAKDMDTADSMGPRLELSEEERASILAAPEFLDFVEQSSKIVQRALNDGYDYIRDYTVGAQGDG